jgi:catechol 2,3-dioxygenase-like lactoylglutathione lyase family enzyme
VLGSADLMAFVATRDAAAARSFYGETLGALPHQGPLPLGLRLVSDDSFALVFDANGTELRVQKVSEPPPLSYTVLGWKVTDIRETVARLAAKGVRFETYEWLPQDESGVWTAPDGTRVAWFKDSDGNLLSLTQFK